MRSLPFSTNLNISHDYLQPLIYDVIFLVLPLDDYASRSFLMIFSRSFIRFPFYLLFSDPFRHAILNAPWIFSFLLKSHCDDIPISLACYALHW